LYGVGVLFTAIFLAGALIGGAHPTGAHCWSATGAFGPVGSCARSAIFALVGPVAAVSVPLLLVLHAARALDAIDPRTERGWRLFGLALMVLFAVGAALGRGAIPWTPPPHPRPDLLGGFPAWGLVRAFGITGAWVVLALAFSATLTATLARNPVRLLVQRARQLAGEDADPPPHARPAENSVKSSPWRWRPVSHAGRTNAAPIRPANPRGTTVVTPPELPPRTLLAAAPPSVGQDGGLLDVIGYRLTGALRSLKLDGALVGRMSGPAVTRFEVEPAPGLRLREVAGVGGELAAAMKVASARIVAPIPGKGTVGVEIPNPVAGVVGFRAMLESPEFDSSALALPLVVGRGLGAQAVVVDLAKMPHLLIAGGAGSGKSMCLNVFVASLVYRHAPQTLRFLMVENGHQDLSAWSDLPHLRHPIVRDVSDAVAVIEWAALEMERRGRLLVTGGARNIRDYNERGGAGALPYIVLLVNEIDGVLLSDEGVEGPLATAHPTANVVTNLLKANFPSRIALRLPSSLDSRRVLDGIGAESLVGEGDMLFIAPGKSEPVRLQGTFLSAEDRGRLVEWFASRRLRGANAPRGSRSDASEPDVIDELHALEVRPAAP
jgi:S-DNA-T family DNA segregation ATPase FtsK/SpoIIIE